MTRRYIGERVKRREDGRLVTGQGRYIDDIDVTGALHLKVHRSPHAHARIKSIDTSRAASHAGVVAVLTADDFDTVPALPTSPLVPGVKEPEHHVLVSGKARMVGDAVAAVVAESADAAADAVELIDVDYEPLPAVVDPEAGAQPDAALLYEEFGTNVAYTVPLGVPVDEAFAAADVVVSLRLENQRVIPNAMETRGIIASYHPADNYLTVYLTTQAPHLIKTAISSYLDIPENAIRVVAPDVGGAFGSKMNVYPEEVLAILLARRLGRPVKWIETRSESMLATSHGRGVLGHIDGAFKSDGEFLGLRIRCIGDLGAHLHMSTAVGPMLSALNIVGCYKIPVAGGEVSGVFTNKTALDPFRGYYRAESIYYIERLMDAVADQLGIDPVDIRRKNFIQPADFPYMSPMGMTYDSGNYDLPLTRALEILDYEGFRHEQAGARAAGRYIGVGISTFAWRATQASAYIPPDLNFIPGGWESAVLRVERNGELTIRTGISPHGQGTGTGLAQIAAEGLDIPVEKVRVVHGDTETSPYGLGTMGSRSLVAGGNAVHAAAGKIREKATALAAHLLEAKPEDIVWENGRIGVAGSSDDGYTLQELSELSQHGTNRPPGMEPGLEAAGYHDPADYNAPFGCHICTVEVDTATGEVKILRYIAVEDNGLIVNPMLADGQTHGGIAQGIGQALTEAAVYDDSGQLLTGSFMGYAMPMSTSVPMIEVERTVTLSPLNELGAKGLAEAGNIGAPPAIVNAVLDALRPLGVKHLDMPLWPERVWSRIQAAKGGENAAG